MRPLITKKLTEPGFWRGLYRGGSEDLENLERLAKRVHELAGWHAELYVDPKHLPDLERRLTALPRVAIDHRV